MEDGFAITCRRCGKQIVIDKDFIDYLDLIEKGLRVVGDGMDVMMYCKGCNNSLQIS